MTIVVEDGSIVTGANSYVTEAEFIAYADARGVTIGTADDPETLLIKAVDYLESFSPRFKGDRVERDQPLSWPRSGAVIEEWEWSNGEIPRQVINAQLALAFEIHGGEDPFNPSTNMPVVMERVEGAVQVQYANPGTSFKVSKTQQSRTIINLLLKNSGLFAIRA